MHPSLREKGIDFNPFSKDNVLKLNAVQEYPQDLYFILRTVLMFRGMAQVSASPTRRHRQCSDEASDTPTSTFTESRTEPLSGIR